MHNFIAISLENILIILNMNMNTGANRVTWLTKTIQRTPSRQVKPITDPSVTLDVKYKFIQIEEGRLTVTRNIIKYILLQEISTPNLTKDFLRLFVQITQSGGRKGSTFIGTGRFSNLSTFRHHIAGGYLPY